MSFRVSTSSSFHLFQRLLNYQSSRQQKVAEQMATGKRINRASDDPNAVKALASFKETLSRNEQYLKNISVADRNWLQIETSTQQIHDLLKRARELAIQGNNGTLGDAQREALAEEVAQLSRQLLSIANTKVNGEYIFAGYATNTKPFALDADHPNANPAATFSGSTSLKSIEIGESQSIEIQIRMDQLLLGDGTADTVDILQTLANLEQALRTNNIDDTDPGSVGQALEDLEIALQQVELELANIGGKTNRIAMAREQLEDHQILTKKFIQGIEEIDLTEAIYEFQRTQTALQATVGAAGSVLNMPSLMDFLR